MTDFKNSNNPLILVVDDDAASRILMRASLKKAGYQVEEAEDGLVAISKFKQLQPDAILLDVVMPKLNGFDTCRAIRKLSGGEHTPILMVTGLDDIDSIHHSFDSGATDFITKPINWTVLTYRVKYMLRASEAFYDVVDKQNQIQELAFFDHLTGLANRTLFIDTLKLAIAESAAEGTQLGALFIDLDRFKNINDTLGHHAGDILLKNVAERISTAIRETDSFSRLKKSYVKTYFSRLGGDEFTIMLPGLKEPEDAGLVAQRINEIFSQPFPIDGHDIYISASIGISIFPMDGSNAETLMKHADLAMYHAKERGRNGFQFYKKSLNIKAKERLEFEKDVREAIQNEDFTLYYQPQVSINNGHIIGAEALSRWKHKDRGMVSPAKFIPVIEELGLIIPFIDWVINQVGKQQLEWQLEGLPETRIAINISSKNFIHQNIPDKISTMLQIHKLNPQFLELELTESVLAEHNAETISTLQKIKELGLSISVDDFGTGYSSLLYLKTFPIDIVKIDRFFIKDILTSHHDAAIVKAIIAMAQSMSMKVIAEGIEEKEQFELLKTMGCDYGQGFLFGPAIPPETFAQMLKDSTQFL